MQAREFPRGVLLNNVPLSRFTSWHVGGPADYFYWPLDLEDLSRFLSTELPDGPITFLGLGSNVLISDLGLEGTVIVTQNALKKIERDPASPLQIYAQVGIPCPQISRFAARQNLTDSEFMSGIPGSLGGALTMNAGCYGSETWQHVVSVETIQRSGKIKVRSSQEFTPGYRHIQGLAKDEWFVSGTFKFSAGNAEQSLLKIRELMDKRSKTQPLTEPTCGSVFKNPHPRFAGQLIESLGLKGYQIGQAKISERHANFIVNLGGATAQHVADLISFIQEKVHTNFDIQLETEVRFLGRT